MRTQSRMVAVSMATVMTLVACGSEDIVATSANPGQAEPANASNRLVPTAEPDVYLLATTTGEETTPECIYPEGLIITPKPAIGHLTGVIEWVDVPRVDLVDAMRKAEVDPLNEHAMLLGSDDVERLLSEATIVALRRGLTEGFLNWSFRPGLDTLLEAQSAASALVALTRGSGPDAAFMTMAVVETDNGGFTVSGGCQTQRVAHAVHAYATALEHPSSYELLRGIAADDDALTAFHEWTQSSAQVDWIERPPRERLLDVEATPQNVLDALSSYRIVIEQMPKEWTTFDAALCTWVSMGWNECTHFAAYDDHPMEVFGFFDPNKTFELWLVDSDANVTDPTALIGVFDAGLADEDGVIYLSVTGNQATLEELIADIGAGEFVVGAMS